MRNLLFICCILFAPIVLYAQQKQVSGFLKNKTGSPVANTPVLLKNGHDRIIGFVYTNTTGGYTISLPDTTGISQLYLEVNSLGYKKTRQQLSPGKQDYDFILEEQFIELPEVKVRNRPLIEHRGDTLSYNVSSFAREEDRNIGDVMRRLPGMTVAENGQVYYNGKPISNLYTDGDDLMDGRYGLAVRTITKEMIKSIDIIQHHQPIKVLKNKVFTDDVALNLVLKDDSSLKLSGQAMLGGGLPGQYDAALNTMLFNKKFKMLNSLKGNNSGMDYRDEFSQFGSSTFLNNKGNTRPAALLSAGTAGNPDIPRSNYYINNSQLVNLNNLFNTKSGIQFRSNIQAFFDRNTFNYNSTINNYLANDTVRYDEVQSAVRKPWLLNTSFNVMVNKEAYFINNSLRLNLGGEQNASHMDFSGKAFNQRLREQVYDLSNDLNYTPAINKKDILSLRWYMNYYNRPQRLFIGSGLNSDILNNGQPYAAISQYAETPTFFSNISASYRFSGQHLIAQTYEVGVVNERQQLNADLGLTQLNGTITAYTGDAGNALQWQRNRGYIDANYSARKEFWEASLSFPVFMQSIRYRQDEYNLDKREKQFFINPVARLRLFLNAEDYLVLNYSYTNNVGNISGVYRGSVLSNYRSLTANDADLQERNSSGSGIQYTFQRSITMLFINAGINYSKVTANTIFSSVLTNNVQRTVLLPYKNDQSNLGITGGVSKYLFGLHTTASLKSYWNRGRYNQFINNEQLSFINDAFTLAAAIEAKFLKVISFSYNGSAAWNKSRQESGAKLANKVKRYDQYIGLGYSPAKNLFLNISGRHIYSVQPAIAAINYVFLDTKIRYKLLKWRTDLEFDITNIANIKNYEIFTLSSNQFAFNRYAIRGRMAIVRATFNL